MFHNDNNVVASVMCHQSKSQFPRRKKKKHFRAQQNTIENAWLQG